MRADECSGSTPQSDKEQLDGIEGGVRWGWTGGIEPGLEVENRGLVGQRELQLRRSHLVGRRRSCRAEQER